jgi:hypothetical protein
VNVPASFENKVKVKLPCAYKEGIKFSGGIAPLIFNHVARWRPMVTFKHTRLYQGNLYFWNVKPLHGTHKCNFMHAQKKSMAFAAPVFT